MRRIVLILAFVLALGGANAQNTLGITGGFGSASSGFYPAVETRGIYGLPNIGLSWRNYNHQRIVGCFGIDLEYMQRGYSFSPSTSTSLEDEEVFYYTRKINSIMLPLVWQPHTYIIDRRMRLFGEAAATFNYDLSSTYDNDYARDRYGELSSGDDPYAGDYEYITSRDNRFGYGLAFGAGLSYLAGKYEVMMRVRYYYGLSDVVRNRNKYYDNGLDGYENPFIVTPMRSPLRNLTFSFGVYYHFGTDGFKSWGVKRDKREKMGRDFNYTGVQR